MQCIRLCIAVTVSSLLAGCSNSPGSSELLYGKYNTWQKNCDGRSMNSGGYRTFVGNVPFYYCAFDKLPLKIQAYVLCSRRMGAAGIYVPPECHENEKEVEASFYENARRNEEKYEEEENNIIRKAGRK